MKHTEPFTGKCWSHDRVSYVALIQVLMGDWQVDADKWIIKDFSAIIKYESKGIVRWSPKTRSGNFWECACLHFFRLWRRCCMTDTLKWTSWHVPSNSVKVIKEWLFNIQWMPDRCMCLQLSSSVFSSDAKVQILNPLLFSCPLQSPPVSFINGR